MTTEHVHISKGITKLGADIPSVSLPPVVTCRCGAPCASSHKCYAMKGRWRFGHNKELLRTNLDIWKSDPESFRRDVFIAAFHSRFFRWHSSGDIPDENYLGMMVALAQELPDTRFLCFTKSSRWSTATSTYIKRSPRTSALCSVRGVLLYPRIPTASLSPTSVSKAIRRASFRRTPFRAKNTAAPASCPAARAGI